MSRRRIAVVLAISTGLAMVVTPAVVIGARALATTTVSPGSVLIGSAIATLFLAISPLLSLLAWGTQEMKGVLIRSYVVRILGLVAFGVAVPASAVDAGALASGVLGSAVAFLGVQTVGLARSTTADSQKD